MALLAALGLGAGALGAGCSNPTDETRNTLVKDAGAQPSPDTEGPACSEPDGCGTSKPSGPCVSCIKVGNWYRFTQLALEDIGGGSEALLAALRGVWDSDIKKKELNILFEVTAVDDGGVHFRVVNGARVGEGDSGTFCVMENTVSDLVHPFTTGGQLGASEPTSLLVYAGSTDHPKNCSPAQPIHAIPVSDVVVDSTCSGTCDPAAEDIISGNIHGGVAKDALLSTCTCLILGPEYSDACGTVDAAYKDPDDKCNGCGPGDTAHYQSLGVIIPAFNGGEDIKYECKTADDKEAACVVGTFTAQRLEAPPEPCK